MLSAEQQAVKDKAVSWMRQRLQDVPDQGVETFSRLIDECCEITLAPPKQNRLMTRADHIEHLAWYFWQVKHSKDHAMQELLATMGKGAEA